MKKTLLSIVLFVISANAFSQDSIAKKQWILKWNATAAIDGFSFPTMQFAIEKKLNNYFSVQTEFGVQLYNLNRRNADTISVKNSGFRVLTEGRFYLFEYLHRNKVISQDKKKGLYTGIQLFYRKNNYNERIEYVKNINTFERLFDDYGISKEVYGINITFGYQIPKGKFVLEPYVSVGTLKRNIKNFDRAFDEDLGNLEVTGPHDFILVNDKAEQSGADGNFSFGFRIGYRF